MLIRKIISFPKNLNKPQFKIFRFVKKRGFVMTATVFALSSLMITSGCVKNGSENKPVTSEPTETASAEIENTPAVSETKTDSDIDTDTEDVNTSSPEIETDISGENTDNDDIQVSEPTETPEDSEEQPPAEIDNGVVKSTLEAKGLYISGPMAGDRRFESRYELTQTTEVNALCIDVKDERGNIMFKNKIQICDDLDLSINYIQDFDGFMSRLKETNVYTIARIVCFKDDGIVNTRPEFAIPLINGGIYREKSTEAFAWLNPYNRDVWEYLAEISIETAKLGFDEIQFDYVRFPTDAQIKNVEFTDEMTGGLSKMEIMIEFAEFMMEKLAPYNIVVSADIFGTVIISDVDAELIGQNYVELAKIYDVLCPMIYPSHYADKTLGVENPDLQPYDIIFKTMQISTEKLEAAKAEGYNIARIRPWLQDFEATWLKYNNQLYQPYTGKQIEEQIAALADSNINEWLIWDSRNNFDGFRDYVGQPYE